MEKTLLSPSDVAHLVAELRRRHPTVTRPPAPAPGDELRAIQAHLRKFSRAAQTRREIPLASRAQLQLLASSVASCSSLEAVVNCFASCETPEPDFRLPDSLAAGHQATYVLLTSMPRIGSPAWKRCRADTLWTLSRRLGLPDPERVVGPVPGGPLELSLEILGAVPDSPAAALARPGFLRRAIIQDPGLFATYLCGPLHRPEATGFQIAPLGVYETASLFGVNCPTNRIELFERLARAETPLVRVAGAVYRAVEGDATARDDLLVLSDLPGFPGAWAAVRLARMGDGRALAKAMAYLRLVDGTRPIRLGAPGQDSALQAVLRALLSNSAQASGVPQPTLPLADWWARHADRVRLHDPWLAELNARRAD